MRNKSAEIEEEIEQLKHDAEHREGGAAFARQLGHVEQAAKMDREAARMRQRCADLEVTELPRALAYERNYRVPASQEDSQ